jgi:hypothetical protein
MAHAFQYFVLIHGSFNAVTRAKEPCESNRLPSAPPYRKEHLREGSRLSFP